MRNLSSKTIANELHFIVLPSLLIINLQKEDNLLNSLILINKINLFPKFLTAVLFSILLSACMPGENTRPDQANEELSEAQKAALTEQARLDKIATQNLLEEKAEKEMFAINPDDYISDPMPNVWDRVRAGFSIDDVQDNPRLLAELKWYAKHQKYLDRVVNRAEPFLHFVLNEAEKRNLPTELVLLPIVESAYQTFAYSHGRASGIWQFIPSTGKIYGLKQNWWYDGRRDVYASTQAALKYLENLNREFKGNWLHALAAYNSGSGTVRRAIRKNKKTWQTYGFLES